MASGSSSYPGMERWRGKVALVTGASAGIGYDLAKQLVQLGMNVVGCARNIAKIELLSTELSTSSTESATGKLVAVKCDVTNEEDVKNVFEVAKNTFGGVDVCVNNAGLAHNAPLLSGATSEWRSMLEVNVLGLCMCTREFMTQLKERGVNDGHIFLLNSMSGHRLINLKTVNTYFYSATKYAVTALTEGIRQELRAMNSNVKVTGISPGLVATEFRGRLLSLKDDADIKKQIESEQASNIALEAEDITSAIIYALASPPRVQIHDILMRSTHQAH